nr:MAG TPA: stabilization protein [Caudoviricetes sp.]
MATIRSSSREKVFSCKAWLGLHESPDGDTKLKFGEAANIRNWRITRDRNLKVRPGEDVVSGLCRSYSLLVASTVEDARIDNDTSSVLTMYPTASAADGKITLSGASVSVKSDSASQYAGYYWRETKFKVWQLVSCDSVNGQHIWKMKRVRAVAASANPRVAGLWQGLVNGTEYVLAACDGKLWKLYDGEWKKEEIGDVDTTQTVRIFGFSGSAYILDGKKYRQWDGTTYGEVAGYVPLVLVSALPSGSGTELEQVNKLSDKRRAQYSPDGKATVFQLPETGLASVDSVRKNAQAVTGWTADAEKGTVTFAEAPEAGTNTIEITYSTGISFRSQVEAMRFSELYNGAQDTRVFLYGDGSNQVFYSGLDTDGKARADYFPDLNVANIGEANTPVTGLIRHYSRLIAFKTESTYSISYSTITLEDGRVTAGFYITPVNRTIGNAAMGQVMLVSNSPRTLHGQDCYEWSNVSRYSSNLSSDERQAKRISDRVYETLSGMDAERCVCWDDDYSQQYFIAFGKTALVHNYAADAWYYYSNFDAVCFLSFKGELYFGTSGGELRKLNDVERSIAGEEIDAYWESGSIDFGEDFRRKYIAQIWVGLKPTENSEVIVTVQTDRKSVYAEKVVQRKMASFANADFTDWSFETNYKPFMQRLKIKAKKVTYYKMVFKSRSDTTGATVVALDMRVRYNGYVK